MAMIADTDPAFAHRTRTNRRPVQAPPAPEPPRPVELASGLFR